MPTQVEAKKERSLSKRVQSLSRFLLEALNKEGSAGERLWLAPFLRLHLVCG